jgi:D-alanyl-D-alanine carboxypeptidase/D-alanyl-D-alanine-endopeptidase (penicillin-binding protein 4)
MLPASCMKIASTAAAFQAFGPDFPLRTFLAAVPPAKDADASVVVGDLWLVGRGDPGLSEHGPEGSTAAALAALAQGAARRGVRRVTGDLVFDASWFEGARVHSSWTDAGASARWFAAEIDALTVNDGCVDVFVEPGSSPGAPGRTTVYPATPVVRLSNATTTTSARKDHGFAFLLRPDNTLEVSGRVWTGSSGAKASASIHDPALLAAAAMGQALADAGIRVEGSVRRPREGESLPEKAAVLSEHATTVAHAAMVANTRSQNLWAETLFRVVGREKGGSGSFEGGARGVREVLAVAGSAITEDLRPVDGSGLSRENRASSLSLAQVLALAWRSPWKEHYFQGFAQPGTGTLDDRFGEAKYRGRVFAKTGTLRGVSGLCGLVVSTEGRGMVFCVLGERVDVGLCRRLQDRVVETLLDHGGAPRAFRNR